MSNRIALAMWVISLCAYVVLAAVADDLTYLEAVSASIAVFLGWAVGRELDPDRPHTATVAVVVSFGLGFVATPSALIVGAAMLALRIAAGTVGRWLTVTDLALIAVIGVGAGGHLWSWPIAIVAGVALARAPEIGRLRIAALAVLVGAFVVAWYLSDLSPINVDASSIAITAGAVVATIVATARVSVTGRADRRSVALSEHRVVLERVGAGVIVAFAAFVGGVDAFWQIAPVGAALAAAAVSALVLFLPRRSADSSLSSGDPRD